MRQQVSLLTQSRFHSPAFNAAIFDGPLRIYFAQYQESLALRVYFDMQKKFKDVLADVREAFRKSGISIFIMLYPSEEAFKISFHEASGISVLTGRLGQDFVVGVPGPMSETELDSVGLKVYDIINKVKDLANSESFDKSIEPVLL